MKKVYTRLCLAKTSKTKTEVPRYKIVYRLILCSAFLLAAAIRHGPGVEFHVVIAKYALRLFRKGLSLSQTHQLITSPMDSVRYFEFDFLWQQISGSKSLGAYLDISSPRLFSLRVITSEKTQRAIMLNPDQADLDITIKLFDSSGISNRYETRAALLNDLNEAPSSFDTIVCISVLEHIPNDEAADALRRIWTLLKPGGRLLLSVPCAKTEIEEYIDFNEYGLLPVNEDGFVFGQRFYDKEALKTKIFSITGNPTKFSVFGEIIPGTFFCAREQKLNSANYPYWREAYIMATQYRYFDEVDALPGLGVIAFEFIRS